MSSMYGGLITGPLEGDSKGKITLTCHKIKKDNIKRDQKKKNAKN